MLSRYRPTNDFRARPKNKTKVFLDRVLWNISGNSEKQLLFTDLNFGCFSLVAYQGYT